MDWEGGEGGRRGRGREERGREGGEGEGGRRGGGREEREREGGEGEGGREEREREGGEGEGGRRGGGREEREGGVGAARRQQMQATRYLSPPHPLHTQQIVGLIRKLRTILRSASYNFILRKYIFFKMRSFILTFLNSWQVCIWPCQ